MGFRRLPGLVRGQLPERGPGRRIILGALCDAVGNGLWLPISILYFVHAGLPPAQVALGMSTAGVAGLCGGMASGRFIHRWGARRLLVVCSLAQVTLTAAYTVVDSFAVYLPIVVSAVLAGRVGRVCRNVLVSVLAEDADRVRVRALTRSAGNAGVSLGVAVAGLVLQAPVDVAYLVLLWGNAVSFLATTFAAFGLPRNLVETTTDAPPGPRRGVALRDGRFLVATGVVAVLAVQDAVLAVGLPLWLTRQTAAPDVLLPVLLFANTVLCVTLQVRASRGTESVRGGLRALRRSGLALAAACVVYFAASTGGVWLASVLLLTAVLLHTVGELWQAAGGWGVSYSMAPTGRIADYQAAFTFTNAGRDVVGPVVVTALVVNWGPPGWFVLAAGFVFAAAVSGMLGREGRGVRSTAAEKDGRASAPGGGLSEEPVDEKADTGSRKDADRLPPATADRDRSQVP